MAGQDQGRQRERPHRLLRRLHEHHRQTHPNTHPIFPDIAALANGRPVIPPDITFRLEASTYSPAENTLLLTWPAEPAASYIIEFSADLNSWQPLRAGITLARDDENPNDTDRLTTTVNLGPAGPSTDLYVRVRQD